jgi:hypothetical protein
LRADEPSVVAQGDLGYLKELKRFLSSRGVEAHLMQPPEGCGSS